MKKLTAIFITALLLLSLVSGCVPVDTPDASPEPSPAESQPTGNTPDPTPSSEPSPVPTPEPSVKLSIVSTIFPQYDWVRQILGDEAGFHDLTLLMDSRVDLHSYQPSISDIVKIAECDIFIHVGGDSDDWVEDVLRQAVNPDMIVVNLMEILDGALRENEPLEGPQDDHGHSCSSHGHSHGDGSDCDEHEYDEHVWLSLRNAAVISQAIGEVLASSVPDRADIYMGNLAAYTGRLSELDSEYQAVAGAAEIKTLLFADRFPFRYLMDDYGISYYAAFSGCSAETEAGFSTIIFLALKVDELGLNTVMVTESSDQSIARTVIESSSEKDRQILVLNAMQSVTRGDIQNGASYISIMESNLEVLKEALK
jgi:zinc transport system substrate-binding protein